MSIGKDASERFLSYLKQHHNFSSRKANAIEKSLQDASNQMVEKNPSFPISCWYSLLANNLLNWMHTLSLKKKTSASCLKYIQKICKTAIGDVSESNSSISGETSSESKEHANTASVAQRALKTYLKKLDSGVNSSQQFIRCNKCKSDDIAWREQQTRSADESATLFFSCNNCGAKWKQ